MLVMRWIVGSVLEPLLATCLEFLIANGLRNSIDVGANNAGSSIVKASYALLIKYESMVSV